MSRPRPEPGIYHGAVFVPDRLAEAEWSRDDVMACTLCPWSTMSIAALARHYVQEHPQ